MPGLHLRLVGLCPAGPGCDRGGPGRRADSVLGLLLRVPADHGGAREPAPPPAAPLGARIAGATTIIAIDPVAEKRTLALSLGATHAIDPRAHDVAKAVREITFLGVHYAFEALGRIETIEQAWSLLRPAGQAIVVGMPSLRDVIKIRVSGFFQQKQITGSAYGSAAPQRDIPRFIDLYQRGELKLDPMITRRIRLDEVNDALAAMGRGEGARSVIVFGQ